MKLEKNDLLFAKVRDNAIIPTKNEEDACYDFYACLEKDEQIVILPGETILVPTGIACAMSNDYYMQLFERGSTGSIGMKESCGVIDSSYRGEIFAAIYNGTADSTIVIGNCVNASKQNVTVKDKNGAPIFSTNKYTILYPKTKAICQGAILPVPKMNVSVVSYDDLKKIKSNRQEGALGSSGK